MKKVLIIAYYWPPAGGPGVQRWLSFVKYLKDFEIEPIVYVPKNPTYPIHDYSLLDEIPSEITILKQPIFEPYALAGIFSKKQVNTLSSGIVEENEKQRFIQKILLYLRGNFFIPDARKFWVKPSVKFLKNCIDNTTINTIITTGPPHSLHLIGLQLKNKLSLNWIADFRDPWTSIGYHDKLKLTKRAQKKHRRLEKKVLTEASHILATSPTTCHDFKKITQKPVSLITNGFEEILPSAKTRLDSPFSLAHIGSLLAERNPENLWHAIAELIAEHKSFRQHFKLKLIGKISRQILDSLEKFGLLPYVEEIGYVSHTEAIRYQQQSQVLLLIEINRKETRSIIPGKLFEYLSSGRPIFAVGPKKWDVKKIIAEVNGGKCFEYDEKEAIKTELFSMFEKFQQQALYSDVTGLEKYTRKALTKKLSEVIKSFQ